MSEPIVVNSFPANITDFGSVFANAPQPIRDRMNEEVFSPMVDAEINQDGHFVTLVIIGHADRQDDTVTFPTVEARRASELAASLARATSARDFVFAQLQDNIQALGGTLPVDRDSAVTFAIAAIPSGAANLVRVTPVNEAQRMENRRVEFFVQKFPKF